MQHNLSTN